MSQISVEKKLELIRVIRSQHDKNKELMRTREELLYGKSFSQNSTVPVSFAYKSNAETAKPTISGFKIRLTIALLLAGTVLSLEALELKEFKEPLNTLYTEISKDGNLFDFVEELTYTLKDD